MSTVDPLTLLKQKFAENGVEGENLANQVNRSTQFLADLQRRLIEAQARQNLLVETIKALDPEWNPEQPGPLAIVGDPPA